MDPQVQQLLGQLAQVFQQGLTLLQQAQQGGMGDSGDEMADPNMSEGNADMGGGNMPPDPDMMGGDDDMGGGNMPPGQGMMGGDDDGDDGSSLHERVKDLENHTGLAKSAQQGDSLAARIDALEDEILGVQYEGPMPARLRQLEKAAGVERTARQQAQQSAPDEISLDALIKSAIQEGISQGLAASSAQQNTLPNPQALRQTAAAASGAGGRRARAPHLQSDEALIKAARQWGLDTDDLDSTISFGDLLQMQYNAQQGGGVGPLDDGED